MVAAKPLLIMRFNKDGYNNNDSEAKKTSISVINKGNITFNQLSILDHTTVSLDNKNRCAYFVPYNESKGFQLSNTNKLKTQIEDISKNFTIYFKYKININDISDISPIISFSSDDNIYPLLYIKNKQYFAFRIAKIGQTQDFNYYSKNIDHTLNNKWHTFCLTRLNGIFRFFVDGLLLSQYEWKEFYYPNQEISNDLYIGYSKINNKIYTFNNGYLDDICIYDQVIYKNSFIPPTNYFCGSDIIENYKDGKLSPDISDFDIDVVNKIKEIKSHTIHNISSITQNFTPRKLKFNWSISNTFYRNGDIELAVTESNYIVISISDLSSVFLKAFIQFDDPKINMFNIDIADLNNNKDIENTFFYEKEYLSGMNDKELFPIIVFANGYFIKLSKIKIIKSHEYYTLLISSTETHQERITELEIILIPFPITYREDTVENIAQSLLYSFDEYGKFNVNTPTCFYYLNDNKNSNESEENGYHTSFFIDTTDEEISSQKFKSPDNLTKEDFVKVDIYNLSNNNRVEKTGLSFTSNTILHNTKLISDRDNFNIIADGEDSSLIQYTGGATVPLSTYCQILSNINANIFYITIVPEKNLQSIIKISVPNILQNIPSKYIRFLLFKNNTLLYSPKDFEIDLEKNVIRLKNRKEFLQTTDKLILLFIVPKDINNKYFTYIEPIYIRLNPANVKYSDNKYFIQLPNYNNITFEKSIIAYFTVDNLIHSPNDYIIRSQSNILEINSNDIILNLSTIKEMMLCLLQIKDNLNYPMYEKDQMMSENIKSGKRFILHDLKIPKWYSMTLNNLTCFDQDGKYIPDLFGYIYNLNIIKYLYTNSPTYRIVKYMVCTYNTKYIPLSYNNVNNIHNDSLLSDYLTLKISIPELDDIFYELMNKFDFVFSSKLSNSENIARALNYITTYNQGIFTSLYEEKATSHRINLNDKIIDNAITLPVKNKNNTKNYYIFFKNGKLANWNNNLNYNNDNLQISLTDITENDNIECLSTNNINNFLLKVDTINNKLDSESL